MVSWGEECADPDFPGVNSRISNASDWIDSAVCNMSSVPPPDFRCNGETDTMNLPRFLSTRHMVEGLVMMIVAIIFWGVKQRRNQSQRGQAKYFDDDGDDTSEESNPCEQDELVGSKDRHTRRGSSYDSIGIEFEPTEIRDIVYS